MPEERGEYFFVTANFTPLQMWNIWATEGHYRSRNWLPVTVKLDVLKDAIDFPSQAFKEAEKWQWSLDYLA